MRFAAMVGFGMIGVLLIAGGMWVLFVPETVDGLIWATSEALVRLCLIAVLVGVAFLVAAWRVRRRNGESRVV